MIKKLSIGLIGIGCGVLASSAQGTMQLVLYVVAIVCICHSLFYKSTEID